MPVEMGRIQLRTQQNTSRYSSLSQVLADTRIVQGLQHQSAQTPPKNNRRQPCAF